MEYNKTQKLLDAYFEGTTTLQEEESLRAYFNTSNVDDAFTPYIPLFKGFEAAKNEVSSTEFKFPAKPKSTNRWWLGIAATVLVVVGVAGFMHSNNTHTVEEQQALAALHQSKEAMFLLSSQFTKGTQMVTLVDQFDEAKNKFLK